MYFSAIDVVERSSARGLQSQYSGRKWRFQALYAKI